MHTLILLLGMALLTVVACCDVRTRRIPNEAVVGVLVLAALRIALAGDPSAAAYTLAAGAAVFLVTFLLFWRGLVGGGDAKLVTAAALLVGYHDLFHFLMLMSLCGLLVTLSVLVANRRSPQPVSQPKARLAVPYGVAIASGAIATLLFQPPLLG